MGRDCALAAAFGLWDLGYIFRKLQARLEPMIEEPELRAAGIPIPDGAGLRKSYTLKAPTANESSIGVLRWAQVRLFTYVFLYMSFFPALPASVALEVGRQTALRVSS